MVKREGQSPLGLYTIGIAALFLAGFFLLVVFGAQNYRNTVSGQNDNMKSRALISYLSTVLRGYDQEKAVQIQDSEYGQTLVIHDGASGYALRIYRKDDKLLEDYGPEDAALAPDHANIIGETKTFEMKELERGLLDIRTDAGQVLLHLRSRGGGE
ncbi:MAG: DUF4860 domain-containing protein [Eubacterium sp.]|nr:DUF4860 domain-containing protein [Eubacterium sp.]